MELLQLKYFQAVAQLQNITAAAKLLYISQPSLSRAIARLEADLGVPLFDRKGKQITLNAYGKLFLRHVNTCLRELETGRQALASLASTYQGTVNVGTVAARFLSSILHQYLQEQPQVKFHLVRFAKCSEAQEQLLSREVDLAFTCAPILHPEVQCWHLSTEEIFLAVSPLHPFAKRESIALSEAREEEFLSLPVDTVFDITNLFDTFFIQAGFQPKIRFECPTVDVIANMVSANLGCALFSKSWTSTVKRSDIVLLPIRFPSCQRDFYVSISKSRTHGQAVREFYHFVTERFIAENSPAGH